MKTRILQMAAIATLALSAALFSSCNSKTKEKRSLSQTTDVVNKNVQDSIRSFTAQDVVQIMDKWNRAHTAHDVNELVELYDNVVFYYTYKQEKELCLQDKIRLFDKNPDFSQSINGPVTIENNAGTYKCSFSKLVQSNGKDSFYDSYLFVRDVEGKLRIIREGDLATDANVRRKSEKINVPSQYISGDFDGDGSEEKAWLVFNGGDKQSLIKFNKSTIPSIPVSTYFETSPQCLNDLNMDGADEIGILPLAYSGWANYHVYSFMNGKWIQSVESWATHPTLWEEIGDRAPVKPGEKDGTVRICYSENDFSKEDFMSTKEKTLPIQCYKNYVHQSYKKCIQLQKPEYDFKMSSEELDKAFSDNKFAAQEKYAGKTILLTGTISSIDSDLFGDAYISLDAGFLSSVFCYFPEKSESTLAKVSKGETVSIIGVCKKSGSLEKCRIY